MGPIGWIREIVLDSIDPWDLARFWARLLGGDLLVEWYPGWVTLELPQGTACVGAIPRPGQGLSCISTSWLVTSPVLTSGSSPRAGSLPVSTSRPGLAQAES
jgi:hypothetical protein